MARTTHRKLVGGLILLGALLSVAMLWAISGANEAKAQQSELQPFARNNVFGLVDAAESQRLIRFNQFSPQQLLSNNEITGLEEGETLVGIDFRPANGRLYGVAINDAGNLQIYIINFRTAVARPVGDPLTADFTGDTNDPPIGSTGDLISSEGEFFGVDFNPAADALRIVNDADENFRVRFNGAAPDNTVVDGTLVYDEDDENEGDDPNVVATAYTNNVAGAASTTQRVIDSDLDILGTQDSNPGILTTDDALTTPGGGERDVEERIGLDIAPGFGALVILRPEAGGPPRLAILNLGSGVATDRGRIGPPVNATDLALPLPQRELPEETTETTG